jgi:hypothetical protein
LVPVCDATWLRSYKALGEDERKSLFEGFVVRRGGFRLPIGCLPIGCLPGQRACVMP